jgi:hypothetical protein
VKEEEETRFGIKSVLVPKIHKVQLQEGSCGALVACLYSQRNEDESRGVAFCTFGFAKHWWW